MNNLTVAENLFIGREPKTKLGTIDWRTMNKRAKEIMDGLEAAKIIVLVFSKNSQNSIFAI